MCRSKLLRAAVTVLAGCVSPSLVRAEAGGGVRTSGRDEPPSAVAPASALFGPATPGGLTSDRVARRAAETSFRADAQRQELLAAQARLDQALVAYFPKLTASASYTRLSPIRPPEFEGLTFPVYLDNYVAQAGVVLPLTDYVFKLSQSYGAASHSASAASLKEKAARLASALEGRVAYYAWLRAGAQAKVAERNLQITRAHLVDARNNHEEGLSSRADVMSAEAQVASADLVVVQARNAAIAAEHRIAIAMHDKAAGASSVGEDLNRVSEFAGSDQDIEALCVEALERRPEIRALDETAWSLRKQANTSKADIYPKLEAFGNAGYLNPNPRVFPQVPEFRGTWDAGIRLSWSPSDTFSAIAKASETRAQASKTEMEKATLADAVRTEVVDAYLACAQARAAIESTARSLAAAQESYRVRRELFRMGRAKSVELQDAEVAMFRAELESVNARANLKIAEAQLRHAAGRDVGDLPSSLSR